MCDFVYIHIDSWGKCRLYQKSRIIGKNHNLLLILTSHTLKYQLSFSFLPVFALYRPVSLTESQILLVVCRQSFFLFFNFITLFIYYLSFKNLLEKLFQSAISKKGQTYGSLDEQQNQYKSWCVCEWLSFLLTYEYLAECRILGSLSFFIWPSYRVFFFSFLLHIKRFDYHICSQVSLIWLDIAVPFYQKNVCCHLFLLVFKCQLFSCVQLFVTPSGSSVLGILQARILEWVAMPSSRESSQPGD